MAVRILRLGTARICGEGPRLGTVRRPPRGVPRTEFASGNWYDLWLPALAPSVELMKQAQAAQAAGDDAAWLRFTRAFRAELGRGDANQLLETLALLSHTSSFSLGCYCEHEARCHRSVLRALLDERGAVIEP